MSTDTIDVKLTVNGREVAASVEPRLLLVDFLRHRLRLTGTHVGCAHGVCGACTVLIEGEPTRSCLVFAAQADGATLITVEGLAPAGGKLTPLQQAFHEHHALQCGFCTPGMLLAATHLLANNTKPSADDVRTALGGNLCRCTGYVSIVAAVLDAAQAMNP
jgi:carbon-monoxide dehydrogenase small subunit